MSEKIDNEQNIFEGDIPNTNPNVGIGRVASELMLDEASSDGDVSSYNKMVGQLQRRAYENSFLSLVAPAKQKGVGHGRIYRMSAEYAGPDQGANITKVLYMEPALDVALMGTEVTSDAGIVGKILYMEDGVKNILVEYKENDKPFVQFDKINGSSIELINSAQFGAGALFENYGGWKNTADGETWDNIDAINLKVNAVEVSPISVKFRTNYSEEFLMDLGALMKSGSAPKTQLRQILRDLLTINLEQKYTSYAKSIATKRLAPLVLKAGIGATTSLKATYQEIYTNINIAIGEIGTDTVGSQDYFVIASSNVVAALRTAEATIPSPSVPKTISKFNRVAGILKNGALLIEDGYSEDDYFLVGLTPKINLEYPSITYIPYNTTFIEVRDYKTLQPALGVIHRCVFDGNGLDSEGKGNAESLQIQVVDMTGLPNQTLR